ncbi:MAG: putative ABC transporter permease [Phoenicibacter congonensis]|uniref:ABC transporter permease n=1 Tax=Phoenicibacter congonensis TaxID=1944646 RepID=A0AA43RK04_9ACTN|nr:putative ABC transporter permease [Phoenicibacter congonensis]
MTNKDPKFTKQSIREIWRNDMQRLRSWRFWCHMVIYFCIFSVVGHWCEWIYCSFNDYFFGIVDPNSGVWSDINYPFFVYGIGVVIASIVLVPYQKMLLHWRQSGVKAGAHFFIVSVFVAMAAELTQGFIQNRPNEFGVYPLWDNSRLPGNILGQAWIVNDIMIAGLLSVFVWFIYPIGEKLINKLSDQALFALTITIAIGMTALTVYEYTTFR